VPVFWTHDVSDILLTLCKILNYLKAPDPIVPISFALFTTVWIFTRHYLGILILKSVATEFRTIGLWGMDWGRQQYKGRFSQYVTFGLLSVIQLLNIYWLFLILKIAVRILKGGEQKDDREDDDEEVEVDEKKYVSALNTLINRKS
jgi:acyl-CoA-dependent ceramide synthase